MLEHHRTTSAIKLACTAILFLSMNFISLNAISEISLPDADTSSLNELINSPDRSKQARARNKYRNPLKTLTFFEVTSNMTVVEIWPGGQGGWYRSILEPYLAESGNYLPIRSKDAFPQPVKNVPNGIADRVLVFRAHGFMIYDKPTQQYYDALFRMLKPGGIFGIVDHRGDENIPQDPDGENGYVNQSHVTMMAEKAGFKLIATSEINANPRDTKDYPNGLYALPPSLKGSTLNKELRQQMINIGESDRMTLKFVKPAT